MKALTTVAIVLLFFVGCATAPAPAPTTAGAQMFTGEVWTWDQPNNIVTLYSGGKAIRVKTTPEQMRTLRLHENARVTGELAPPADIPTVVSGGPPTPVPRRPGAVMGGKGTVGHVDSHSRLAATSDPGPLPPPGASRA